MAEKNGTENLEVRGTTNTESGKHTNNTSTKTTTDGRGKGKRATAENNSGSGATEKNAVPEVASVKSETSEAIPTPTEPKKARKKRTVKKKVQNDEVFNAEQITSLLMTVSVICAGSGGRGQIFALTENECKQLAKPLSKLIANNDGLKAVTEHSDGVALATACFLIFAPKIFAWLQYEKAHRKPKDKTIKVIKGEKAIERKAETDSNGNSGTVTANGSNGGQDVLSSIPSIM